MHSYVMPKNTPVPSKAESLVVVDIMLAVLAVSSLLTSSHGLT